MKTLRIVAVVALLAALAVALAGCGGATSVSMRSGKVYYHQNKDYAKAADMFRKAIAEDPKSWEAHFYLALSLANLEQYVEAGQEFDTAYDLAPPEKKALVSDNQQMYFSNHFKPGLTAKDTGNMQEAAQEFEKAVAVDPKEVSGYINLAFVYGKLGQKERALGITQKAVQVDSTSVYAWSNLGAAYRDVQQYDLAAQAFEKAVALAPADKKVTFGALASLGDINFDKKDFTKALEYYSQAAEMKTEAGVERDAEAKLQYQVGASYYQLEKFGEASVAFKKCADLTAGLDETLYNDAMYNLGVCYIKIQNYDGAIATFQTLLAKQDTADLHEMLGRAYGEKGLKEEAIEEFKKAEALRPK